MAEREVWEVEPREDGTWALQREGASRATSVHDRKQDAVDRGRELGERHGGQVRVKGPDGEVQSERTYGDEPEPAAQPVPGLKGRLQQRASDAPQPVLLAAGALLVALVLALVALLRSR